MTSTKTNKTVQELVGLIDSFLDNQFVQDQEPPRPESRGTLFVDYEAGVPIAKYRNQETPRADSHGTMFVDYENGVPVASYQNRNRVDSLVGSAASNRSRAQAGPEQKVRRKPLIVKDDRVLKEVRRKPLPVKIKDDAPKVRRKPLVVKGHDPETGFEWDYNGRIMHVHRDANASRPSLSSAYSEYYELDAQEYEPDIPMLVVDKEVPGLPRERHRREKVVAFIEKMLRKLHEGGVMKLFRNERVAKMAR